MLCMTSEALDADDRGFLDEFFGATYSDALVLHSLCFRAYAGAWVPVVLTL